MKSFFSRPFRANAAAFDRATLAAFEASQAIIQFDLDGTILAANENFLGLMGYSLEEVVGKHHAICRSPRGQKRRVQGVLGGWSMASSTVAKSGGSARVDSPFGSRPATIPCSMTRAGQSAGAAICRGGAKWVQARFRRGIRLSSMLEAVNQNSTLVEGIASASQEQASSIAEMVTAIRLLDEMTQHNAALVEETNAAIEQAEGQASELDGIVEIFQFQEERTGNVVKLRVA